MQALWLYIKHNKLQDSHEKEFINCNRYFRQVPAHPQAGKSLSPAPTAPPGSGCAPSLGSGLHHQLGDGCSGEGRPCHGCQRLCFAPQIFNCVRMRFSEIPMKLAGLLQHPDPIIINHTIRWGTAWPLRGSVGWALHGHGHSPELRGLHGVGRVPRAEGAPWGRQGPQDWGGHSVGWAVSWAVSPGLGGSMGWGHRRL